jgi:hypothetical protein
MLSLFLHPSFLFFRPGDRDEGVAMFGGGTCVSGSQGAEAVELVW